MGRKRKVKLPVVNTCQLCHYLFRSRLLKNDQVHNPRCCACNGKEILSTDPICDDFKLAAYFHCDKTSHQITFPMCDHRVEMRMEGCGKRCKQREEVAEAEARFGAPAVPRERESLLKVRVQQKPRLKKRVEVTIWDKPEWD